MSKIILDLHAHFNNGKKIDNLLISCFEEAIRTRAEYLEIIHGKGSGQLKKRVQRFLQNPEYKCKYKRIKNDPKNFGRLFVYF